MGLLPDRLAAALPARVLWPVAGVWLLAGVDLALFLLLLAGHAVRELLAAYRARRRRVFSAALEAGLSGRRRYSVWPLAPRRWGDAAIVEGLLIEAIADRPGPAAEKAGRLAEDLGLVDRRLAGLERSGRDARAEAMEKLGLLKGRKAVAPLVAALKAEEPALQIVAAKALGRLEDERAVPALIEALERWPGPKGHPIAQAIAAFGERAVPFLRAELRKSAPIRARAARLLGEIRSRATVPDLVELLARDEDPEVRTACASALGLVGHPGAAGGLVKALKDPYKEVRAQAARSLGMIGADSAAPALDAALAGDSYYWARVRAAEALARSPRGRALLERRRDGPDPVLRTLAGEMLSLMAMV